MPQDSRSPLPTADQPPAARPPSILLWLSLGGFLVSMDSRVVTTVLPQVAADFTTTVPLAGWAVTAYLWPYGLFQLAYGPLGDRIGAMRVVGAAMVGFALAVIASGLAPTLSSLIVVRFVTGAIGAAIIPLALATIGNVTAYGQRQAAISVLLGATATGQVLSAAVGGLLAQFINWRAIFILDGLLALALVVPLWQRRHTTPPLARAQAHPFVEHVALLRDRRALALFAAVMFEGAFLHGGMTYLGGLLREREGLEYAIIGLTISLYGLASLIVSRFLGRLSRRLGENALIAGGATLMGLGFVALGALPGLAVAAPAVFVMGVGFSLCHSTFQTRATELRPTARGTAISLFAFALFFGGGTGTPLLGKLLETGGYTPVLITSGVGLLCLALAAPRLTGGRGPAPASTATR